MSKQSRRHVRVLAGARVAGYGRDYREDLENTARAFRLECPEMAGHAKASDVADVLERIEDGNRLRREYS